MLPLDACAATEIKANRLPLTAITTTAAYGTFRGGQPLVIRVKWRYSAVEVTGSCSCKLLEAPSVSLNGS